MKGTYTRKPVELLVLFRQRAGIVLVKKEIPVSATSAPVSSNFLSLAIEPELPKNSGNPI
jgi:hypothetical protein